MPSGLVVVEQPQPVQLRVRAPRDGARRLRPQSFTAQVDATGHGPARRICRSPCSQLPTLACATCSPSPLRVPVRIRRGAGARAACAGERHGPAAGGLLSWPRRAPDPVAYPCRGRPASCEQAVEAVVDVNVDRPR